MYLSGGHAGSSGSAAAPSEPSRRGVPITCAARCARSVVIIRGGGTAARGGICDRKGMSSTANASNGCGVRKGCACHHAGGNAVGVACLARRRVVACDAPGSGVGRRFPVRLDDRLMSVQVVTRPGRAHPRSVGDRHRPTHRCGRARRVPGTSRQRARRTRLHPNGQRPGAHRERRARLVSLQRRDDELHRTGFTVAEPVHRIVRQPRPRRGTCRRAV